MIDYIIETNDGPYNSTSDEQHAVLEHCEQDPTQVAGTRLTGHVWLSSKPSTLQPYKVTLHLLFSLPHNCKYKDVVLYSALHLEQQWQRTGGAHLWQYQPS